VILALSGGTGGSKMVDGLAQVHGQPGLAVVVNTGDDADFYGLRVCPDLDICTYVLAGVVDRRGWGYADDSFRCLEGLATYGHEAWFGLGDRDLATHIHRTLRLAEGAGLAQVTAEICARLGVEARVLPMSEDAVRTRITTAAGPRSFQEYLVRDGAAEEIERIELVGAERARPAPGLLEAIAGAERIVICPSSPVVSIGTILSIPGVRAALAGRRADCAAVSPIVGRRPVEGPADRFLRGAGYDECSATEMARIYADVAAAFVLDARDAAEADAIAALGVRPVLADALMPDRPARARLAAVALEAAA
jgi:LPPG:FO 2-phospho-L-lactate transferase